MLFNTVTIMAIISKIYIMKKFVLLLIIVVSTFFFHQSLSAQEEKNARMLIYAELGGPGVIMSANFDSRFKTNERLGLGFRLGAGFGYGNVKTIWYDHKWNYKYTEYLKRNYYSIPAGLNYVFGKPDSDQTFEVGAGATFLTHNVSLYTNETKKAGHFIGFFTFMYRKMPVNGGFSWRIGLTPVIGTSGELRLTGAIGIGYAL